ncbi:hypothetical protein HMPREF9104_00212 [Lentilactobacillus kisonensis F0435]|uniref:Uncharacterized protein n=1 Tax=Lentilactobacillus kisonensis F0435 TaxID=797516 RepID=H1LC98_9LACO|nr:hypothetical protein HMPREF9104_00212 [Lentilactobacillus kisonensis F0435]
MIIPLSIFYLGRLDRLVRPFISMLSIQFMVTRYHLSAYFNQLLYFFR